MSTFIIIGVVFGLLVFAFIAGITIEARYGKNKYVTELATAGESLLPAPAPAPVVSAPVATHVVTPAPAPVAVAQTPAFAAPTSTPAA